MFNQKFNTWIVDGAFCFPSFLQKTEKKKISLFAVDQEGKSFVYYSDFPEDYQDQFSMPD